MRIEPKNPLRKPRFTPKKLQKDKIQTKKPSLGVPPLWSHHFGVLQFLPLQAVEGVLSTRGPCTLGSCLEMPGVLRVPRVPSPLTLCLGVPGVPPSLVPSPHPQAAWCPPDLVLPPPLFSLWRSQGSCLPRSSGRSPKPVSPHLLYWADNGAGGA